MLKDRVISSLVGVPIIILFLFLGQYFFALLIAAIAAVSMDEFYSMLVMRDYRPNLIVGMLGGILVAVMAVFFQSDGIVLAVTLSAVAALIWHLAGNERLADSSLTILAILYVAVPLSHMILQYDLNSGRIGVLLVFIGTWISDIAAYTIGRAIGKRKLAPNISAKKTVEGFLAGIIAPATILAIVFALPWLPFLGEQGITLALFKGALLGLLIGIAAPVGDLVESRIKREMRIKDSGVIIPGHGGFLDRFDSVIFTAVVGYYFWLLMM